MENGEQHNLNGVWYFNYSGVTIKSTKEENTEIEKRIARGNRRLGSLDSILMSKSISKNTKFTAINHLTYGGE